MADIKTMVESKIAEISGGDGGGGAGAAGGATSTKIATALKEAMGMLGTDTEKLQCLRKHTLEQIQDTRRLEQDSVVLSRKAAAASKEAGT